VCGIVVIGLMGRGLLWSMRRVRGGKNSGGLIVAIFAVGLALLIIGYVGYFFGRLIQAAVSRQREFLADASAVQFTRNPQGIGGALRKIGGYALGSRLVTNQATAIGHFFFAQGFRSTFGGAWATHPPLPARIRAIDPAWDGRFFDPPQVVDVAHESFATKGFAQPEGTSYAAAPRGSPPRGVPFHPQNAVADVGQLTDAHYAAAAGLLAAMPDSLREAARQTASAPALVYGLLNGAGAVDLVRRHDAGAGATFAALAPALAALAPEARLPLLLLAVPALRQLKAADMERFLGTLDELVHADARVSTFEFVLQKLLTHHLRLAQRPHGAPGYFSFVPLTGDIAAVLNALAHAGAPDEAAADRAYRAGTGQLPLIEKGLLDLPRQAPDFAALDAALEKLAGASLPIKKRTLLAAAHVIGRDGTITVEEGELYRAIAAAIDCPLPPLATAA
ncbi:MAG: M48 family metalloprotease, partial [Cephaloticoccus sp.]